MPELPEVETTLRGISPHLIGEKITHVRVRQHQLRWPVPENLSQMLTGQTFTDLQRRAKYLLLGVQNGTLMMHLGMSGSLRIVKDNIEPGKHDHVDVCLDSGWNLRYRDPRRFGSILWIEGETGCHPLLKSLGPEPLSHDFDGDFLYALARKRKLAVKAFIMDQRVVVGVGNIYANEALYVAGIRPDRAAGKISRLRYDRLVTAIKQILKEAIRQGGTTLRDFTGADGDPGYFRQSLCVYGRAGQPCKACGSELREIRLAQRSTIYCLKCQT